MLYIVAMTVPEAAEVPVAVSPVLARAEAEAAEANPEKAVNVLSSLLMET